MAERSDNAIEEEDIGHEFFEKLIRGKRIEYVENPIRWLYAVTDRIVINFLNRKHMLRNVNYETLKMRSYRAKQRLRELLEREEKQP